MYQSTPSVVEELIEDPSFSQAWILKALGGILEDWKSSYVILVHKIDKDKCALTLTTRMERLPVKTTGGDNTQRTDGRYTVSYCDFLRIAKEISFHHFGLQVCTGKCGDVTHLDNCKEFNSVLCKT